MTRKSDDKALWKLIWRNLNKMQLEVKFAVESEACSCSWVIQIREALSKGRELIQTATRLVLKAEQWICMYCTKSKQDIKIFNMKRKLKLLK